MATKRRGGFRTPELRGTLGTLLRTTTDVVRGAIERGAREGRARLDDVRSNRRRQDALAELGDLVLDLIRRGEIDLAELPEARDLVRQLDDIDAEDAEPEAPRAVTRRRFDDRATIQRGAVAARRDDGVVSSGARRGEDGVVSSGARRGEDGVVSSGARRDGVVSSGARPRRDEDDGVVSSGARRQDDGVVSSGARPRRDEDDGVVSSTARPRRAESGAVSSGARRDDGVVSGPHRADDDGVVSSGARPRRETEEDSSRFARPTVPARPRHHEVASSRTTTRPLPSRPDTEDPIPPPRRPSLTLPHDPHRKGGISFDDDDLHEYMHPDDVPPKTPAEDPDDGEA